MDQQKSRGGRPGITLDEVRVACASLELERRFVGAVNVRLELGRGSYSTIQMHLRQLGYVNSAPSNRRKS